MPKAPRGEKRPADAIGRAVMIAKIAAGEIEDRLEPSDAAAQLGRLAGEARARKLTESERREIAKMAANSRLKKSPVVRAEKEPSSHPVRADHLERPS